MTTRRGGRKWKGIENRSERPCLVLSRRTVIGPDDPKIETFEKPVTSTMPPVGASSPADRLGSQTVCESTRISVSSLVLPTGWK